MCVYIYIYIIYVIYTLIFKDMKEWDESYPGGVMYAPVVFAIHILSITSFLLVGKHTFFLWEVTFIE